MSKSPVPDWRRLLWRRLRLLGALALGLGVAALAVYWLAPQWIVRAVHWHRASEAGLESHELRVDGQRWVYYQGGEGPTIMLLHGFGGRGDHWVEVAGRLTSNFRVIVPDLPGWGRSTPLADGQVGPRAQARRLAGFIARVAPRNLVLIGHGSGGLVAGLYATAHPGRVAALGLVASAGAGHRLQGQNDDIFAYTDRPGLRHLLALAWAHPPDLPGSIAEVYVERNRARIERVQRGATLLRQPRQAHALESLLPPLAKPVWLAWCHDDRIIDYRALDVIRRHLHASPRIDVTTLFDCSHMPMLEKPEATARAITRFMLPTHRPSPPPIPATAGTAR